VTRIPELGGAFQRVSPDGLRQQASVSMARLTRWQTAELNVADGHAAYLVVVDGSALVNGRLCAPGDGALALPGRVGVRALDTLRAVAIDVLLRDSESPPIPPRKQRS
jgi:redox-sensitive bicupin YhaK (pirin superfamily)